MLMRPARCLFAIVAVMGLSSCAGSGQNAGEASAAFASALDACSKPMAGDAGTFDQKAVATAGWIITSRTVFSYDNGEERKADLSKLAALKAREYESTQWQSYQHMEKLEMSRNHTKTRSSPDVCRITGQVNAKEDVALVVASISKKTGVPIGRRGEIPRGGDFLTPRFDSAPFKYYWELPKHNVYLTVLEDHGMALDIESVPDRSKLNPDFDTPEHRIPGGDSNS